MAITCGRACGGQGVFQGSSFAVYLGRFLRVFNRENDALSLSFANVPNETGNCRTVCIYVSDGERARTYATIVADSREVLFRYVISRETDERERESARDVSAGYVARVCVQ